MNLSTAMWALFVVLVVLKLLKLIAISWWAVFSPLWIGFLSLLVIYSVIALAKR